jgi:feruloyl esterase
MVEKVVGTREATQDFLRLFMVPGMHHCGGGEGAGSVDWLSYLEAWVENGLAPVQVIGSHVDKEGAVTFTRPIYPYPVRAMYRGKGDPNAAESFGPAQP